MKKRASSQATLFEEPTAPAVTTQIAKLSNELASLLAKLPIEDRVTALNHVRAQLHSVSPFNHEPVDCVVWVKENNVERNDWNPNSVPSPEMHALHHSMEKYGITMPIVASQPGSEHGRHRITDGFHRNIVCRTNPTVRARTQGYLPLSILKGSFTDADQMSATILHNKARGVHAVEKDITIVGRLREAGWSPDQIGIGTVKSDEELVRMQQVDGAAKNLATPQYGKAWDFDGQSK